MNLISIEGLNKNFHGSPVLKNIQLEVEAGKLITLIGRSGCGKSTLLRCINGLEVPDSGKITIGALTLDTARPDFSSQAHLLRGEVGFVFQSFNLFPHLTVLENVVMPQRVVRKLSATDAEQTALLYIEKVGLTEHRHKHPHELSGGQQQRAAIARALAMKPRVMLYDEPTSALDPELVQEVLQVMKALDNEGMTQIIVTHEMRFAREASDEIIYMDQGEMVERRDPDQMFTSPQDPRTQQFLRRFL